MVNPTPRIYNPASKFFTVGKPFTYNGRVYNRGDDFEADQIGFTSRKLRVLWDNRNLGPYEPGTTLPPERHVSKEPPSETGLIFDPRKHSIMNTGRRWMVVDADLNELYRVKSKVGHILDKAKTEIEVLPDDLIEETE